MCGFRVQLPATVAVALLLWLGTAPPAFGVVGGAPVPEQGFPWFVTINGCGGTLVAPDRVLTSADCLPILQPEFVSEVRVGTTEVRRATRIAQYPGGWGMWNYERLDDVALVRLDRPVSIGPVVRLGRRRPKRATVLGRGDAPLLPRELGPLHAAKLQPLSDATCAGAYRGDEDLIPRFLRARMECAVDPDGTAPLAAACDGDDGGPLFSGPANAPVIHGLVSSWSEARGQDGKPTVYTDVRRYRAFIQAGEPEWAPLPRTPPRIRGRPRPGRRLTCGVRLWLEKPDKTDVTWYRGSIVSLNVLGERRTYRVRRSDRGHTVACGITAENGGGSVELQASSVYVPR